MLKRISVESILVMFLFILFTGSIGVLIIQGRDSYETIINDKNDNENMRIAYSYISKRIKQNDIINRIDVIDNSYNDNMALRIGLTGQDLGYEMIILCLDNHLIEVYQPENEQINVELGEKIVDLPTSITFSFDQELNLIHIMSDGHEDASIKILDKVVEYEE